MKTFLAIAVSILLLCRIVPAQTFWPMYGADREHTSHAKNDTLLKPPLQLTRSIPVKPEEISTDGVIIACASMHEPANVLEVRDFNSGELIWSFEIPGSSGSPGLTPAITSSLVLCGSQKAPGLYALDRLTGAQKWFKSIGDLYDRHPVVDGGYVYIARDSLYCIEIRNGATKWSYYLPGQYTPAVDDQNVYVARNVVRAFDKLAGTLKWEGSACSSSRFSVGDNQLYIINQDTVIACNKKNGARIWAQAIPGADGTAPEIMGTALANGYFCFTVYKNNNQKGGIYVFNTRDGAPAWHYEFAGAGAYPPAIANGVVYCIETNTPYDLYGFDLENGAILMQVTSPSFSYSPIIAQNQLFVMTQTTIQVFANAGSSVSRPSTAAPDAFALQQNHPNPFNAATTIAYEVAEPCHVTLRIFNVQGEEVAAPVDEQQERGAYRVVFAGSRLPSGVYIYQISMKHFTATKKCTLLR